MDSSRRRGKSGRQWELYTFGLLTSWHHDLQLLQQFAAEWKAAGIRLSMSRAEAMVLGWKKVKCDCKDAAATHY